MKSPLKFLWKITPRYTALVRTTVQCVTVLTVVSTLNSQGCCDSCCNSTSSTNSTEMCSPKTLWFSRSAGDNLVLDAHRFGYRYSENCCSYGAFGISYRYQQTTEGKRIAEGLFGGCGLSFAGSLATSRTNSTVATISLLADYFGLSQKQDNLSISFCPRIKNHCLDFRLYAGLEDVLEGLYMQFSLPLISTHWDLAGGKCCCPCNASNNCCSTECCAGSAAITTAAAPNTGTSTCGLSGCQIGTLNGTPFPAGYMSSIANGTIAPVSTLLDALNGKGFGDFQGRTYGKFSGTTDDTKFAGIYFDLGYNFIEDPDYNLGVYLKVIAPTGTNMGKDTHVKEIFYPVIGDYQWQLGGGISGHWELYNCENNHTVTAYLQGYVTHMFASDQVRAFDLTNGTMSRYMLMKEFVSNTDLSYNNKLWSVIDWSTRKATINVAYKGEGLIEFVYHHHCGFSAGVGYEIYGRAKETICKVFAPYNSAFTSKTLGLKGNAPVYADGYVVDATGGDHWVIFPPSTEVPYNVSATQSSATAYKYGTVDSAITVQLPIPFPTPAVVGNAAYVNSLTFPGLTNPSVFATDTTNIQSNALQESGTGPITAIDATTGDITGLTRNPTILTDDNIDRCSALLNGYITNKVFGHIDYIWDDCCWEPSVYAGAEGEFGSCCDKNAMNAWGIWIGGSVAF